MFDEGAKLDDILNVLRPPTLDKDDDKKNRPMSDAAIRYEVSKKSFGYDAVNFEFAGQKTTEVLK
ncbi:MAG: hypothetical protein IKE46_05925 [Selenomonadaceae bacterium]|nr:hypothetical protein [Selenomonadaceae bacterium]MBR2519306.1 hypothetical protein [Selenomonadaceae bacterium]